MQASWKLPSTWGKTVTTKNGKQQNAVQRLYQARQLADRGIAPTDDAFAKAFPNLWDLMTSCWLGPEERVDPANLVVMVSAGDWLFKLASPSLRGTLSIATRTFAEGTEALELALATSSVPWSFWLKKPPAIRKAKRPE
jgi:hypothetical protein